MALAEHVCAGCCHRETFRRKPAIHKTVTGDNHDPLVTCRAAAYARTAAAQAAESPDRYPSKPITIIVPFSAGGPADNVTRYIANQLGKTWNQQVVVENRTGAGGMIGPRPWPAPRRTAITWCCW